MKKIIPSVWQWLGGGENAVPGNPAAVPPVLPVNAVETNHWRAFVLLWPFLALCSLTGYLLVTAVCGSLKQLVYWSDSAKAQTTRERIAASTQAQSPASAVTVTNTTLEVEKIHISPSTMENNHIVATVAENGRVEATLIGQLVKVYPNAKVVPNKITPGSVRIGGEGTVTNTVPVPVGKSVSFTPPPGVIAEWQDHKDEWHPCVVGQHPNQQAIRFTATNIPPQEFTLLWSDI